MKDRVDNDQTLDCATPDIHELPSRKRPYEAPTCEKKRSIHRVTLLSGMGVMSMGVLSMTN